jgi:hypothetical protein
MLRRFALLGALIVSLAAGQVAGQALPLPPHRFFGAATVNGQPAAAGTVITSFIGSAECGSFTVAVAGRYVVDVLGSAQQMGCGRGGETIQFRIGNQTATQMPTFRTGGFEMLDLTFGGSAAQPFNAAFLNLDDPRPCIPVAPQTSCDATRTALWNGDQAAWQARFAAQGLPAPTPDDVFVQTLGLRIESDDPATVGSLARQLGWAHVRLFGVKYGGAGQFVEVRNLGGAAQDLSGWSVRIGNSPVAWNFNSGFSIQPAQTCRLYVSGSGDNACPTMSGPAAGAMLPATQGAVQLWVNFLDWKVGEIFYTSDPSMQPPPPNPVGTTLP